MYYRWGFSTPICLSPYIYIYTYAYTYIHTERDVEEIWISHLSLCIHICIYTCIHGDQKGTTDPHADVEWMGSVCLYEHIEQIQYLYVYMDIDLIGVVCLSTDL